MGEEPRLLEGDCRLVLPALPAESADAVVTDPPYELGFMGRTWDSTGVALDPATWKAVLRVLKPGGYLLAFGGTRTCHRLTCAIEDAGFEIRDCLLWLYGTGMPKGKGCLKPAWEPVLLARRPAPKVLPMGTDLCRIPTTDNTARTQNKGPTWSGEFQGGRRINGGHAGGRWPANVLHDGSDEVMEAFAEFGEKTSGMKKPGSGKRRDGHPDRRHAEGTTCYADSGSAGRFFYCARASKSERGAGNNHPTVKPLALMRWLVRLVAPPGGCVLDPFAGSGTTLLAATLEGRPAVGIEQDAAHCAIIRKRLAASPGGLFDHVRADTDDRPLDRP